MYKATQQASEDISQNQAALMELAGKLSLSTNVPQDRKRAKEILAEYEARINELAGELQKDPLAFRRKSGDILGLSRRVQKEWTTGEAAAILARNTGLAEWDKTQKELVKSGKIDDPESIPFLRKQLLGDLGEIGWDPATQDYNQWKDEYLVPYKDFLKPYIEFADKIKPQINAESYVGGTGQDAMYIIEHGGKTEKLTIREINEKLLGMLNADDAYLGYAKQRGMIGAQSGYTFTKGSNELIPYWIDEELAKKHDLTVSVKDADGNITEQYYTGWNPASKIGQAMESIAGAFVRDNQLESYKRVKENPYTYHDKTTNDGVIIDPVLGTANVSNFAFTNYAYVPSTGTTVTPAARYIGEINQLKSSVKTTLPTVLQYAKNAIEMMALSPVNKNRRRDFNKMQDDVLTLYQKAEEGDMKPLHDYLNNNGIKSDALDKVVFANQEALRKASNLQNQYDALKTIARNKLGLNATPDQVKAEINAILLNKGYAVTPVNVASTTGGYALTPQEQREGYKAVKGAEKWFANPANWGDQFLVQISDGRGKIEYRMMTMQELRADPRNFLETWQDNADNLKLDVTITTGGAQNTIRETFKGGKAAKDASWSNKPVSDVSQVSLVRNKYSVQGSDGKRYEINNNFALRIPSTKEVTVKKAVKNPKTGKMENKVITYPANSSITVFLPAGMAQSKELNNFIANTSPKAILENEVIQADAEYTGVTRAAKDRKVDSPQMFYTVSPSVIYDPATKAVNIYGKWVGELTDQQVRDLTYEAIKKDINADNIK